LAAADPDIDRAGDNAAGSGFIDNTQVTVAQSEFHSFEGCGVEMDALESRQSANRSAINAWMREIKLHNLVTQGGTRVGHANRDSDRAVGGDLRRAHFRVGIIEGRKTQAVPEGIERGLGEVAIGAARHRVVAKRRELRDGLIESNRKPSCGIVVAGKNIGDSRATFFARIPGFENGGRVFLRPIDGECAAAGEDNDQRLSRGGDGLEKLFLRSGKIEVQAIATKETRIAGITFLTFELRGDADDSDDDVRPARGVDGILGQIRRQPEEARRGFPPAVEVLDSNRIGRPACR